MSRSSSYLPTLTWLRGLAAFVVVVSHAIRTVEGPWSHAAADMAAYFRQTLWFPRLFDLGSFGVCLFFGLSGFTLYLSNRRSLQGARDVLPFYVKRVARIWPAFMVSLLAYTAFALFLWPGYDVTDQPWMTGNFRLPEDAGGWFSYILLLFDLSGPPGLFVGPYWSLPIEFHYYLLMAPVAVLMSRSPRFRALWPVMAGGVLFLAGYQALLPVADTSLLVMAPSFFLGVAMAELHLAGRLPGVWHPLQCYGEIGAAFAVVTGIWQGFLPWVWMTPAYTLSALVMIHAFLNLKVAEQPGPVGRLLGRYGTVSYSVYLFHMLCFGGIALAASHLGIVLDESRFWPVFLLGVAGSFGLAELSYRWVEEPSIAFGRRAGRGFDRRG